VWQGLQPSEIEIEIGTSERTRAWTLGAVGWAMCTRAARVHHTRSVGKGGRSAYAVLLWFRLLCWDIAINRPGGRLRAARRQTYARLQACVKGALSQ
jgi:hypothetical protein